MEKYKVDRKMVLKDEWAINFFNQHIFKQLYKR